MKNKGFTLIELLAVLTILALIALITVPGITGALKKYKNNLYENQIKNIESAARIWTSDNMLIIPNDSSVDGNICVYDKTKNCPDNYNKLVITLKDLQDGGYIDSNLKNVRTKRLFNTNTEIIIQKINNKIEYQVIDQEYTKYEVGDTIIVTVSDGRTEEFYVIEDSDQRNNYVKAILKNQSSNTVAWCTNCTTNDNPNTIDAYLNEQYTWNNVKEKRLITKTEFEHVVDVIKNDADKTWINGTYWTSTTYGTTQVYYVNGSEISKEGINGTGYNIRPVIRINKTYVKRR